MPSVRQTHYEGSIIPFISRVVCKIENVELKEAKSSVELQSW